MVFSGNTKVTLIKAVWDQVYVVTIVD